MLSFPSFPSFTILQNVIYDITVNRIDRTKKNNKNKSMLLSKRQHSNFLVNTQSALLSVDFNQLTPLTLSFLPSFLPSPLPPMERSWT